jgi:hypothetical protein
MTQRTRLELDVNKPTEITLLFDEPISGKSQYGEYHMYAVAIGDEEYSYFAPIEVHEQLSKLRKGDKAQIIKLAAQRGNKIITSYEVKTVSDDNSSAADENISPEESKNRLTYNSDGLYEIMLLSYRQALQITSELGGLADPSRIAITLFIARSRQNY